MRIPLRVLTRVYQRFYSYESRKPLGIAGALFEKEVTQTKTRKKLRHVVSICPF